MASVCKVDKDWNAIPPRLSVGRNFSRLAGGSHGEIRMGPDAVGSKIIVAKGGCEGARSAVEVAGLSRRGRGVISRFSCAADEKNFT
jgi:hypothetical protein